LLNRISDPNSFGGTVKTSALGLSADSTIQMIGTRNSSATSDSRVWEMTGPTRDDPAARGRAAGSFAADSDGVTVKVDELIDGPAALLLPKR
jgi:hypothetical protein